MENGINIKLVDFKYLFEENFNARKEKNLKEYIETQYAFKTPHRCSNVSKDCFSTGEVVVKDLNDLKNIFGKNIEVNNYINYEKGIMGIYRNSGQDKKGIMFEPIICTSFMYRASDLETMKNIENLCNAFIYLYQNSEDYKECIENFKYKLKLEPYFTCDYFNFGNILENIESNVNKILTERANEYPDLQPLKFDILNEDVEETMNKICEIVDKEIEKYSNSETVAIFSNIIREKESEGSLSDKDLEQLYLSTMLKEARKGREKELEEKIRGIEEEIRKKREEESKEKNGGCTIF